MSHGKQATNHSDENVSKKVAASQALWEPNVDVYVTGQCLMIKVEIAGIQREHIEVSVEGDRIIRIRGYRADTCRPSGCRFLMMNISYGPFERVIELPGGYDLSLAKAVYVNGFLQISIPAASAPRTKKRRITNSSCAG